MRTRAPEAERTVPTSLVASPPPLGTSVAQVETRIVATIRIAPAEAGRLRFVQVRGARGSRTAPVPKAE